MIGQLNMYIEPGTVLGPNYNKELLTAHEHICEPTDDGPMCYTTIRYAQTKDFQNITEPRSVTEHSMITVKRSPFGPIRTLDPYEMPMSSVRLPTPGENVTWAMRHMAGTKAMPAKLIAGKGTNGRA